MTVLELQRRVPCGKIEGDDEYCMCGCNAYDQCMRPDCQHCCKNYYDHPCVYIMVGLPGSGKSYVAQQIADNCGRESVIHSTDNYFMIDGKYKFNRDDLARNHKMNQEAFKQSCRDKIHTIIVDNTNLNGRDRRTYVRYAKGGSYRVVFVVVGGFSEADVHQSAKRNTHGVPLETIARMAKRASIPQ